MTTDKTTMSFAEVCAEIRVLLADVPQERWLWSRNEGDHDEQMRLRKGFVEKGDAVAMYGVVLDDEDMREHGIGRMVCITGNGPNSRKHARLLMLVRAVLPDRYRIESRELLVGECQAYEFPEHAFHETHFSGDLAVTLITKRNQDDLQPARILAPHSKPLVHAFEAPLPKAEWQPVLTQAREALLRAWRDA